MRQVGRWHGKTTEDKTPLWRLDNNFSSFSDFFIGSGNEDDMLQDIAGGLKTALDREYSGPWSVIVGNRYGASVDHSSEGVLFFALEVQEEQLYVLLYKSNSKNECASSTSASRLECDEDWNKTSSSFTDFVEISGLPFSSKYQASSIVNLDDIGSLKELC